jgi:transposase
MSPRCYFWTTIRSATWYRLYQEDDLDGLMSFSYDGIAHRLSDAQQDKLKACITETLPGITGAVGAWIEKEFGITYESRSGLVALLHRLGESGPRFRRRRRWNGQTRDRASQAKSRVEQAGPGQADRVHPAVRKPAEPAWRQSSRLLGDAVRPMSMAGPIRV